MKHLIKSVVNKLIVGSVAVVALSQSAIAAPELTKIEFWDARDEQSTEVVDHSAWQALLNVYLDDQHASGINRFDYKSVSKEDIKKLDGYLDYLQSVKPRQLNTKEQFAYWVNLYNAQTVDFIIEGVQEDDIKSIKEIRSLFVVPGPWKRTELKIEGKKVSLDNIEHGILRPIWLDHRIHFSVNCASIGCPNLLKTAFTASNTDDLLDIAEEEFLQHPRAVRLQGDKVVISSLLNWYGDDFAETPSEMYDYLSDFVSPEIIDALAEEPNVVYDYDWNLNAP